MSDEELLLFAAKAAGYEDTKCTGGWFWVLTENGKWDSWTPLNNDGDAFRLAVKLKLVIILTNIAVNVSEIGGRSSIEPVGDDPYTATRRAIVRAAAEIGRNNETIMG